MLPSQANRLGLLGKARNLTITAKAQNLMIKINHTLGKPGDQKQVLRPCKLSPQRKKKREDADKTRNVNLTCTTNRKKAESKKSL
jgi:hypothetical protein